MTIQLLKNGVLLLTAKTGHRKGDTREYLPVTYEGDLSLIDRPEEVATARGLEDDFTRAARRHGLEIGGDYRDCQIRTTLVLDDEEK